MVQNAALDLPMGASVFETDADVESITPDISFADRPKSVLNVQ
jgi:hypothetical protein